MGVVVQHWNGTRVKLFPHVMGREVSSRGFFGNPPSFFPVRSFWPTKGVGGYKIPKGGVPKKGGPPLGVSAPTSRALHKTCAEELLTLSGAKDG